MSEEDIERSRITDLAWEFLEVSQHALPSRLSRWAHPIAAASLATGICPFLIAAVMDRESQGGEALSSGEASGTGDNGHGRGLMQIDDRSHKDFLKASLDGGEPLWQLPEFNI